MGEYIFGTNPEKAASKVAINSFMAGGLFVVFTLIWTLSPKQFSELIILQLVLSIPLLFVSSLAYTKIGYQKDVMLWDNLAWHTNSIGNAFILNIIGLLVSTEYPYIAILYFTVITILFIIYTAINISLHPHFVWQKIYKFGFFMFLVILLGILPLFL